MDVTYVIVTVYVTERNDVIKRHSVITVSSQYGGLQQSKWLHY